MDYLNRDPVKKNGLIKPQAIDSKVFNYLETIISLTLYFNNQAT